MARLIASGSLCLALGIAAAPAAHAQNALPAGSTTTVPTIFTDPTVGDTLLSELSSTATVSLNGATMTADVASAVYETSNGALDFFYQIQVPEETNVYIEDVGIRSFEDTGTVDVAQTTAAIGGKGSPFVAGSQSFLLAQRPGTNGDGIDFLLNSGATGGQSTDTVEVITSATQYDNNGSIDVAGGGLAVLTPNGAILEAVGGPGSHGSGGAVAPEPGSLALLPLGPAAWALGLLLRRRRRTGWRRAGFTAA